MSFEAAIDEDRLWDIVCSGMVVSGDPVRLPSGITINGYHLVVAVHPVIARGKEAIPELVQALESEHVHVRYAADAALRDIVGHDNIGWKRFEPFFPLDHPTNRRAMAAWRDYIASGYK